MDDYEEYEPIYETIYEPINEFQVLETAGALILILGFFWFLGGHS